MPAEPTAAPPPSAAPVPVLDDGRVTLTREDLRADVLGLRRRVPAGGVAQVRSSRAALVAAALVALDGWASRVDLLSPAQAGGPPAEGTALDDAVLDDAVLDRVDDERVTGGAAARGHDEHDERRGATRWRLYTSGTTGAPKPVDHTTESLARTVRRRPDAGGGRAPWRWGLLYEPTRMAGLQVLLQALVGGDAVLDATGHGRLHERLRWLRTAGVDALSATPTLWRQALQGGELDGAPLAQVTLGGEIADQELLTALARAFPGARVTHVFASTETGAAFAVSDGRAGFPRAFLDDPPRGVRLRVVDGVLQVHAPQIALADADGFVSTGDVVELTDDRVLFRGRGSGLVNIGGVLVAPEQVEEVLRARPEVADAVVRAQPNPFSGAILVADVVPGTGHGGRELAASLRGAVRERLGPAHVPARIRLVDALGTSPTGKAARR